MGIIFSNRGIQVYQAKSIQSTKRCYRFFWLQLIVIMSAQLLSEIIRNIIGLMSGEELFIITLLVSTIILIA